MRLYQLKQSNLKLKELKLKLTQKPKNSKKIMTFEQEQEPDLSEKALDGSERKIKYVKNMFTMTLRGFCQQGKDKEIGELWLKVIGAYQWRNFFNFDYLYNILMEYENLTIFLETKAQNTLILAIILQRIGGTKTNFTQNANLAKDHLIKLGVNDGAADWVKELILSSNTFKLAGVDSRFSILRDLQYTRLGINNFQTFMDNQNSIYQERLRFPLTRAEFYKCQLIIFRILQSSDLFVSAYFIRRYEAIAKNNIENYIKILESKIDDLDRKEMEERNNHGALILD